ncbi:dephospho-CoA kinase [Paucibacter oligotrophus]|uniref:Dephospho-CoA kinase n=1 Tax=Roseateles oligotrophus TaxID=1769250 RepID=A0A840LDU2_9BURK|nr:dephospho-CoA kinase [Roseateles oligotrophus]MBB4844792.1 dephospho-CoA kinase [Roseateles oligotrophus]
MKIGLTGGIGSGKSTVARCWAELGACLIDTDAIARSLTLAQGAAMPAIAKEFGPQALDENGALDRAWMRQQAFAAPGANSDVKRRLEAILHPLIGALTQEQAMASTAAVIVFDVPLLVESGRWRQRVDKVLVVDCEPETQIARVIARNAWTREATLAVLQQQASRSQRRACADAVLYNEAVTPDELKQQVLTLARHWT